MPKKPTNQDIAETALVAWYKWEFLRRNAEYKNEYYSFISKFGSWFSKHGFWYETRSWGRRGLKFFAKNIAPAGKAICECWQIRDPISPEWVFSKAGVCLSSAFDIQLPTDCANPGTLWELDCFLMSDAEFEESLPLSTFFRPPRYELKMKFDLREPFSVLMLRAKDRISSEKKSYDRAFPPSRKLPPKVRRRLDSYDHCLKVWDLKALGNTFIEIGELLFPGQQATAQRAADIFKRAKTLINGGYKELR